MARRTAGYCFAATAFFIVVAAFLFSCNVPVENEGPWEEEGTGEWRTVKPLHERYEGQFLIGNIISPGDLSSTNTTRFDLLKRHFNTATAENHMKPDYIAPSSKPASDTWNYQWTNADKIVDAVNEAGMKMHGHTLVWHSQTPSWLASNNGTPLDRTDAIANLKKYVTEVVTHFKGRLISWDVVNEAMRDGLSAADVADWKTCLRTTDNPWYKAIGYEYIEIAFKAARAADPDARLFYNDYSLNSFQGNNKQQAVFKMVQDINKFPNEGGRKLIDGIGMQSHHHLNTTAESVKASLALFSSLGVEITISELDIQAAKASSNTLTISWGGDAARLQAQKYADMFKVFMEYKNIITRVTFWGLDDGTSWRSASHPTLLNNIYGLKIAFYAVASPWQYNVTY